MTKKDYEKFANAILYRMNQCKLPAFETETEAGRKMRLYYQTGVQDMAYDIIEVLKADNPRFDREQFLKACGIE